jgi:hypothetical protein
MAIIPQRNLFSWKEIENLGDLERLRLVIRHLPDERLMRLLEVERAKGRDDYPVRAVWNTVLAGVVYQHVSIESLRRELLRNAQLRQMCGLDPLLVAEKAVPPSSVYTRFLRKLMRHQAEIEAMFDGLVEQLHALLPGFGRNLAGDGKAIHTHARRIGREAQAALSPDGRRDADADVGKKTYRGKREDGSTWEKLVEWFGFKIHLIVDADYELPVAYEVTRASESDLAQAAPMIARLKEKHSELFESCETFIADKAYDDGKLIRALWDDEGIKPVIDIRNMWKDGEETKLVEGTRNVVYNYKGDIFCHCRATGERRRMPYGGFEKDRETLKYRCPAEHYGIECKGKDRCPVKHAVRIPLEENRRIFTPLARSSYAWEKTYGKRTAVERVNSRLDVSFGFERHFIRGQKKMKLRCSLALIVMLAMAVGRIKEKRKGMMRSLIRAA